MSQKAKARKKNKLETQQYDEVTQDSNSIETSSVTIEATAEPITQSFSENEQEKVKLDFPFSEFMRMKAPKLFEVAETAATQWKNDEKFENLGISHPVAEIAVAKALEKAKNFEKKLEEKGVISAAKMGYQVAKIQAEEILKKIRK